MHVNIPVTPALFKSFFTLTLISIFNCCNQNLRHDGQTLNFYITKPTTTGDLMSTVSVMHDYTYI